MLSKVLVTGGHGQLGAELTLMLQKKGFETYGLGHQELDITDLEHVRKVLREIKPDVICHTAAYTAVDKAESDRDNAFLVNAYGTRNIAIAAEEVSAKLVYVSTDYVFNGEKEGTYSEFDFPSPLGVYGQSKYAGEQFVRDFHSKFFITRTSWVYGQYGGNFVKTMLKLAETHEQLKVVNDQKGCPTYTKELAEKIIELFQTDKYGVYHLSNSGSCTWYEFAKAIFEIKGINVKVDPCTTDEFPRPAKRPKNSEFEHMALRLNGFKDIRAWKEALKDFLVPDTRINDAN
ncbi:dTDP-4-dehydrorhamnose reductase [Sporolactobacillus laevolacticus]|uniref:dTDP-4-dehydrorhamnose reductase n=1 Tax=Sporolactobacillus laevolacticus TaxID=33018 RepID=UPI0025B52BE9|nr:dTDP-4-dehydrorhamnose reductase [Sporolactobacillus laevolacticus]MDN3954732.1 dTDP-4-dehydrorhamnose reductase [Sporolactobacillus laevolacticus]